MSSVNAPTVVYTLCLHVDCRPAGDTLFSVQQGVPVDIYHISLQTFTM